MYSGLDLGWERVVPIAALDTAGCRALLAQYSQTLVVEDMRAISLGCRNSNYQVKTNHGPVLLRLCAQAPHNEILAAKRLAGRVSMPQLLFAGEEPGSARPFLIYEYVEGAPLQMEIQREGRCRVRWLEQAAAAAAVVHTADPDGFTPLRTPPFAAWYELFLSEPCTRERLGKKRERLIRRLVERLPGWLAAIDSRQGLIHNDFRPANMILDKKECLWVVDWEMACPGHILGDLGQFFRYRQLFGKEDYLAFERAYYNAGGQALTENWAGLCLLRDMVNQLQMLAIPGEFPNRTADCIQLLSQGAVWLERECGDFF